jgi:Xaa-Pro aminopeptidase
MKRIKLLAITILLSSGIFAQDYFPEILPLRKQAEVIDEILEERFHSVLPALMRREGIDMWVIISREYNEDPVIKTMLPSTWLAARRRTVLVIFDKGEKEGLEGLAVARYNVGAIFKSAWNPEKEPDQWKRLVEIISERNPKKIGLNYAPHFGHADGLAKTDYDEFMQYLPKKLHNKVTSAQNLSVAWLETRTKREMAIYEQLCRIAHNIIAEGFSEKVITPGVTTTEDVVWWYRQRINQLGLETWFHPTVDVQRADPESFDHLRTFDKRPDKQIIQPGDLIHCDFGITYLRLNTDTQQNAYVLKPGEEDAPEYLKEAFKKVLRTHDILTSHFKTGRTGNEILRLTLEQAKAEGLKATIYTHPIGYHGHGAGPAIGMWDNQGNVPHSGDYPLYPNTAFSIELNTAVYIEEWKKEIRMMTEEEAFFDGKRVYYIDGRQTELMLIPRRSQHNSQK